MFDTEDRFSGVIKMPELGKRPSNVAFAGPDETQFDATAAGNELRPAAKLSDTSLPGIYTFRPRANAAEASPFREHFVVNFDRGVASEKALFHLLKEDREEDSALVSEWRDLIGDLRGSSCERSRC